MYKQDLPIGSWQGLICHKAQQTELFIFLSLSLSLYIYISLIKDHWTLHFLWFYVSCLSFWLVWRSNWLRNFIPKHFQSYEQIFWKLFCRHRNNTYSLEPENCEFTNFYFEGVSRTSYEPLIPTLSIKPLPTLVVWLATPLILVASNKILLQHMVLTQINLYLLKYENFLPSPQNHIKKNVYKSLKPLKIFCCLFV